MDWNSLKIFLAIAETGSLSAAAKKLGVNHSTVFRRLNAFEHDVGGRLFERVISGYQLTAMGEDLLAGAKSISQSFDDLERDIVGRDIQPKGVVKITAPNNIAYRYLPRYITEFNRRYGDIQIELLASNQEFNMSSRQADIAVRATSSPPDHLIGRQVRQLRWAVYSGGDYALTAGLPASVDDLKDHAMIGACGTMTVLPAFSWLEKNLPQQICLRCDDLVSMSYIAESGIGLALLPDDQQRPEIQRLFTFTPGETSNLWLLIHPDLKNVERFKLVMQHLAAAFKAEKF